MNFVIYLLDGLTPLSIKSDQNKFFFGKKIKDNFLSKIKRKSLSFENAYGYGETYSTVYQLFTGINIYDSYCDAFELVNSFPKFINIPYYFRLNNFNTYMYSDASYNHPTEGFYKRFFNSINNNFDEFCNFKKTPKYKFNNFLSDLKKRKKLNIKKKNNFYFFHDHSLHDSKYVYRNATPENYLQGVNYSSELIKKNLKKINFNFKKDVLVFLSDHGLNIRPHDKMHFKEKISNENYDNYCPHLYDDEKIKMAFWIYSPKLKKKNYII